MTPAWILDIFAAIMLVVAAVSAARLVASRLVPARLVARRASRAGSLRAGSLSADIDVAHLLMGIAMAGMLASSLTTMPDTAWEVIFGLLTAWFAWRVVRDARANGFGALTGGHCVPHLVHSAAMLYMFLALSAPASGGGMSGMGMGGPGKQTMEYPTLALVFTLVLVGYSIWDIDQLSGKRYSGTAAGLALAGAAVPGVPAMSGSSAVAGEPAAPWLLLSPGVTIGCRIAMGITMAFMLVI